MKTIRPIMLFHVLIFSVALTCCVKSYGQDSLFTEERLKREILEMRTDVNQIQMNLTASEKKFKRGILVATIGYTLTITGGLMLGRQNDKAGQVLLVAGGVTGAVGTVLMVDSFKYLGRAGKKKKSYQ